MSVWVSGDVTKPWEIHDCEHCRWWNEGLPLSGKCGNECSYRWGDTTWSNELCDEWENNEDETD